MRSDVRQIVNQRSLVTFECPLRIVYVKYNYYNESHISYATNSMNNSALERKRIFLVINFAQIQLTALLNNYYKYVY